MNNISTFQPASAIVAVTVDLHQWDEPMDISFSAEWLAKAGIRATYFVMSEMFRHKCHAEHLRRIVECGHEVGSHSHQHSPEEMYAIVRGEKRELKFLEESKKIYEDFYGTSPSSFRSPCWCKLGPAALDEIQRLGYTVDSSVTPQRLGMTGFYPYEGSWFFSSRKMRYLRPGLLEVPSSAFLIPASSTAFRILRNQTFRFVKALVWEAENFANRVVTLELHPEDFNPDSTRRWVWDGIKLKDFMLRKIGGLGFRHYLQDSSYRRISQRTHRLLKLMSKHKIMTLSQIGQMVGANQIYEELKGEKIEI